MAIEALRYVSGYTTKLYPHLPTILRTCQAKGGATVNKVRRVLVHVSVNKARLVGTASEFNNISRPIRKRRVGALMLLPSKMRRCD